MKALAWIILIGFGALMVSTIVGIPPRGDVNSPASTHVSPYYIESCERDMATPNIVTAVLADYRGYDTLGETTVVFAAGLACLLILFRRKNASPDR